MRFPQPRKSVCTEKIDWKVSPKTKAILKYYSQWTHIPEEEIVDMILSQLTEEPGLIEWANKERYKTRMFKQMGLDHLLTDAEKKDEESTTSDGDDSNATTA